MISLKNIQGIDYKNIISAFADDINCNSQEWTEELMRKKLDFFYHDFFSVEGKNGDKLGFAYSFDFRLQDSNCKIKVTLFDKSNAALVEETICKIKYYIFKEYPIKTIYYTCFPDEVENSILVRLGFTRVANLKEYIYRNGKYEDEIIYAVIA